MAAIVQTPLPPDPYGIPRRGGCFELREGTEVRAWLRYADYTTLQLEEATGAPDDVRLLVDAVAEMARFRGVKVVACEPELEVILAEPRYRDVRERDETAYETREVVVPVSPALRAFLREVALVAKELDAHDVHKEDERRARRRGDAHVWILRSGGVELELRSPKGPRRTIRLGAEEVWRVGDGTITTLTMHETTVAPTPDAGLVFAERLLDGMVADGTIELAGGDAPAARHAQVFALAERLAPLPRQWGARAPARLGAWLLEQPEIDDVFGDDADLLGHLLAAAPRAPE